ncbi:MAG: ABC transporter ATP-binding protein [Mangrovicoccus sp.]
MLGLLPSRHRKAPDAPLGTVSIVNMTKYYQGSGGRRKTVLQNANALIPAGKKVALLGRNGAGKSTVMRILAGKEDPDSGYVARSGTVSWPVGLGTALHPELTGLQNTRFIARIYGMDSDALVAYVYDFTELGDYFFAPLRTYSSGMRARLNFGVSMGVPFDCYLVDEITAVGDQSFREKCTDAFRTRLAGVTCIMATHSLSQARTLCDLVAVLDNGRMTLYDDPIEGVAVHEENLRRAAKAR